jgi:hypothetical protein
MKDSQGAPVLYPLKISSFQNVHNVTAGYNSLIYSTLCSQDLTLPCLIDVKILPHTAHRLKLCIIRRIYFKRTSESS